MRIIAHAKIKTDAIDAAVLAKLYASGFLPEVWMPDQKTLSLRRQVAPANTREIPVGQRTHWRAQVAYDGSGWRAAAAADR